MELQDHQTHLKSLVSQANTLSNEIDTKKNLLLKVQGAIEYLSELGVNYQNHQQKHQRRHQNQKSLNK